MPPGLILDFQHFLVASMPITTSWFGAVPLPSVTVPVHSRPGYRLFTIDMAPLWFG
jgi:hypothetical protein